MTLMVEATLAFIFVYVFLCVAAKQTDNKIAGLVIGLTFAVVALFGMGITGAAANPARSIGPAVMTAIFRLGITPLAQLWLFIVAPLIGSCLAAITYVFLNRAAAKEAKKVEG